MKAVIYSLVLATLVWGPALGADVPSLVGTWTGQRDRIAKVEGRRGGLATLVITQQQGNTFVGHLKRSNPTGDEDEQLWGAFAADGQLMMGSEPALRHTPCVPGSPGSADFRLRRRSKGRALEERAFRVCMNRSGSNLLA